MKNIENVFQIINAFTFSKRNIESVHNLPKSIRRSKKYLGDFQKEERNLQSLWYGLMSFE